MYFCTAKNMEQFISQLSVSFPNNNKSIFTGIPIKFNLFISNNITSVDTEMCCPKGKCGCQYFILLT